MKYAECVAGSVAIASAAPGRTSGSAITTEVTVREQESAVELEYRVIGVNGAGDGPASNIVRVVL